MTDDLFPGFASHWIDGEAGRIFARSGGSGPPLVLLHGFPQTHACWHRIAPALAERTRVVCLDLRGYGWSSAPRRRPRARDLLEARHGPRRGRGHGEARPCALRARRPRPRRPRRLPPRARPARPRRAPSAARHPADASRLAAHPRRRVPGAPHWEFLAGPSRSRRQEIGRDPLPYFDGLLAKWSKDGTLEASTRARSPPTGRAATSRSRIHAFCEDYRAGATVDLRAGRGGPRRRPHHRLPGARRRGAILPHPRRPRRCRVAARGLAADLRAASGRRPGQFRAFPGRGERRRRRLRRCKPSSEHRSRERRRRPAGDLYGHQGGGGDRCASIRRGSRPISPQRIAGFKGPLDGRAVQGRAVEPDLSARNAGAPLRAAPQAARQAAALRACGRPRVPRRSARCTRRAFRSPSRCSIAPTRASSARRST